MRISSGKRPLNRTTARNSFLINQFATPGLGSLMAGRWMEGIGQLILAVIGFCLVIAWFFFYMLQFYQQLNSDASAKSVAWLGEAGAVIFAVAWLWALVTSLSLLRKARANEANPQEPGLRVDWKND
jgi:hypothetical protein